MNYLEIQKNNKLISEFLGALPEIEYIVANLEKDSIVFQPKHCGDYFPADQKISCDKFLAEQKDNYPDGWVNTGGYTTTKTENYPHYESDWNLIMRVVADINKVGYQVIIGKLYCTAYKDLETVADCAINDQNSPIQAAYATIVKCIQWNNEHSHNLNPKP